MASPGLFASLQTLSDARRLGGEIFAPPKTRRDLCGEHHNFILVSFASFTPWFALSFTGLNFL